MNTALFLDYFFPPLTSNWRGIAFAKYLPEFGWQPIFISAAETVRYDKDYSLLEQIPENTSIFRVEHREPSIYGRFLKSKLKILPDFPDYYKSWFGPCYRQAKQIIKSKKIDLIYSASPTFVAALVAMRLKEEYGIPWVADFEDGWAVNDFLLRHLDLSIAEPFRSWHKIRIRNAEKKILQSADRVSVLHPHVKERWCALHGLPAKHISVITGGYDEATFSNLRPYCLYPDRLTITFLGSFYSDFEEDFSHFLDAVSEVDGKAQVVVIGRAALSIHKMNRANTTCILNLPQRQALSFGLGSDFVFVVMPSYAKWTPYKTYDYLRLGRPIIALVPPEGDAARIVKEAQVGIVLPYEKGPMREAIQRLLQQKHDGLMTWFNPQHQIIEQYDRRVLIKRMAEVFCEVVQQKTKM